MIAPATNTEIDLVIPDECEGCGVCCRAFNGIRVEDTDIIPEEFLESCAPVITEYGGVATHMLKMRENTGREGCSTCTALEEDTAFGDLTSQANHLGVTIEADIIKQKLAENNGGYPAVNFGKTSKLVYENLTTDHPIDLTRYQLAGCYMGRAGLINSGGASGTNDFQDAVRTAVINKRAGGMGMICGRKAFQRPMSEGVKLINAIQDVYLDKSITVA